MFEKEIAQLAAAIHEAVAAHKRAGSITTRTLVRVRRRDLSLKYHEDFGFAHFAPERIETKAWDWRDQETFLNSVVKDLEEYKSLASASGLNAAAIDDFARTVCAIIVSGLGDAELMEEVSAFGRQIESKPLPVKVVVFIDGLSISESPVAVSDHFVLRRPTPEDVAEYVYLDEYGGHSFPLGDAWFRVVGDCTFAALNTGPAQADFMRIVEALRLFRVGGVAANRYIMRSRHPGGGGILSGPSRYSRYAYTLSPADAAGLNRFLQEIAPLLPDPFQTNTVSSASQIAYTRYRDALFQAGPVENPITSAITALEALFLQSEPELRHRLAQRVSVFLRVLGTQADAPTTYQNVSECYGIRSTFIHGSSLKAKDRPQADSLAPVLLEYARQCVLAFFQIANTKEEILRQIDQAMIDPASVGDLAASLASVVHR
jgi:hypothetical protein